MRYRIRLSREATGTNIKGSVGAFAVVGMLWCVLWIEGFASQIAAVSYPLPFFIAHCSWFQPGSFSAGP